MDVLLGLVGGVTSILWSMFGKFIAPYQNFENQAQLIRSIYPTLPKNKVENDVISSREEAHEVLEGTIIERDKFSYSFSEYFSTWLLKSYFCCCIRKSSNFWKLRQLKYERYGKAVSKMNNEVDILKHVSNQRVSEFISKIILKKH